MTASSEIQITDIEGELAHLGNLQKEKKQVKAALFNLIVYAQDKPHAERLNKLVLNVIEKFPCRIIFILKNDIRPDYLHVVVSHQIAEAGEQTIVCDRIFIEASAQNLVRIPFIILPHILPDLPVNLLWGKDPSQEKEILPHLKPLATKIIFASEYLDGFRHFSRNILSFMKDSSVDFMDINWALLSSWRDVLSKIFDTPTAIERLQSCNNLNIRYSVNKNSTQREEVHAVYLFCWLVGQLNWKFQSYEKRDKSHFLTYKSFSNQIAVTLTPQANDELPQGSILGVEIACKNHCLYSIACVPDATKVVIHTSSADTCELPITLPLPCLRKGFTFMKELFYFRTTEHYRHMLEALGQVNW